MVTCRTPPKAFSSSNDNEEGLESIGGPEDESIRGYEFPCQGLNLLKGA